MAVGTPATEAELAWNTGSAPDQRWHLRKDGTRFWADGLLSLLDDATPDRAFVKITRDATDERRAEEALLLAHNALESRVMERTHALEILNSNQVKLYQRLVTAQEEERRRISRELHDETGQDLTALLLGLGSLQTISHDPAAIQESVMQRYAHHRIRSRKRDYSVSADSLHGGSGLTGKAIKQISTGLTLGQGGG